MGAPPRMKMHFGRLFSGEYQCRAGACYSADYDITTVDCDLPRPGLARASRGRRCYSSFSPGDYEIYSEGVIQGAPGGTLLSEHIEPAG